MTNEDLLTQRELYKGAIDNLTNAHYSFDQKKWFVDEAKTIPANEEETKEFQLRRRVLRFKYRNAGEEFLVENGTLVDKLKFVPLVTRRKALGDKCTDSEIFSFHLPVEYQVCGCTDEDLAKELNTDIDEDKILILVRRAAHHVWLGIPEKTDVPAVACPNPKKVEEMLPKHVRGDWDCRSCLNIGSDIKDGNDAASALLAKKALEWCPRFLPGMRGFDYAEYVEIFTKDGNKYCYAGLVHSEMSFIEQDDEKFVKIEKMCDTCGWRDEKLYQYNEPEPIQDGAVLQNL